MWLCVLRALLVASPSYLHPDEFMQSGEVFVPSNRPWEFQPEHALRSPVFPWLMYYVPQRLLHIWWSPRIIALVLSFVVDAMVWRASGHDNTKLVLFTSSWPALILLSRSFSNGFESVCVAAAALLRDSWLVGVVGAVGLFARFTFPIFLLPQLRLPPKLTALIAAIIVAVLVVLADSWFFGRRVITPLNAFLYNVQSENVAQHGLHPRYLHALVNVPMLLGPVVVSRLRPSWHWLLPLALLSISPHQEPRFLLPLVAPAIATCDTAKPLSQWQLGAHLAYHGAAVVFFGFLHQGGLIASVRDLPSNCHVVYWKTYPPPLHLLTAVNVSVVDLKGAPFVKALREMRDLLIAPGNAMADSASLVRGRCWGPHVATESFSWGSKWQLCEWRKVK